MNGNTINDESVIVQPNDKMLNSNPFPGIRAFEFNESHLFFGQDAVCNQILAKLRQNRFVCVMGSAGIGKTSLINCGVKPALHGGFLFNNDPSWKIYHFRPGFNPLQNLTRSFLNNNQPNCFEEELHILDQIYFNILKRGKNGLVELLANIADSNKQYCFIIDQFEDLFTLGHSISNYQYYEEVVHYINLFLDALKNIPNFHLVISLRSDFTNDCVSFPNLAELINGSNVLVPKMSRDQLKEAIYGPLRLYNVEIEDSLMLQILNDVAFYDDELPRMQYALKHTWKLWMSQGNMNKPISTKEYENTGGVANAISINANALYDTFSEADKSFCEKVFKGLTQRISEENSVIRPESFGDMVLLTGAKVEDIKRIVTAFSTDDAQILTIRNQDINPVEYIELTHVALIKAWDRLNGWVEDEAISSQMYKQLAETSSMYQTGKVGLLQPPDLNFALNWKEKQKPGLHWAKRYNPAFERTMVYLDASLKAFDAEEELKRTQAKKAQLKIRSFFYVFVITVVVALGFTLFSQFSRWDAEQKEKIALRQKNEAVIKSEKAEVITKEAIQEKQKAEIAASEAEKLRQLVLEEKRLLEEQKQSAELSAEEAILKRAETEQSLQRIAAQKAEIEKNAQVASAEKNVAEKEKEETFHKRMLATAQSLAIKSNQVSGNRTLRALLALQAYKFNDKNGGNDIQADIFSALVNAAGELGVQLHNSLKGHSGTVNSICMSPRSNTLYSTGVDGKVYAWNANDESVAPRLIAQLKSRNLSIAISSNSRYLAVGTDLGTIRIIDLSNIDAFFDLKGHVGPVFSVAFSKDAQQLFSSAADKKVLLWDINNRTSTEVYSDQSAIRVLKVSPDGRFLAGGAENGSIMVWDIKSNQMTTMDSEDKNPVYSLAFNNYGTMLASGDVKGNVKLWNPFSHKLLRNLKSHTARVIDIKFGATGDLMATASYDGSVYIFDTKYPANPPNIIHEPATYIMSVSFSSDNQRIYMGTNKADFLLSWPCQSGTFLNTICSKMSRDLSTDEWNTYIGSDVKYEKQCE
jgi:WD40 repeat protein